MPGAFEIPHALRDGLSFGTPVDTGERYDLLGVGAGLSGLAAALVFRRRAGEGARILLLDCRDEFGGHARRDEFRAGGRLLLGYGGGQSLDTPSTFSPAAAAVLKEAGVELERLGAAFDQDFYFGRGRPAVFFDRETFGRDALAAGEPRSGPGERPAGWAKFLAGSPLSP
ncbi:MAG: NAD(P)-binding protein, partial [Elusimicrobia bacterium]|nr:NAD(P)-binding protein [Elusimicrobiota bacterium]